MLIDVDVDDQIRIHVAGMLVTVAASDVVDSVREFNDMRNEIKRLKELSVPVAGAVLPNGSVEFWG